jgi:hypothetical protein
MRRHDGPTIDIGGNLGDRKAPATPPGNAREIGWGRAESGRGWPVASAFDAMAGTTIPHKILSPHMYGLC